MKYITVTLLIIFLSLTVLTSCRNNQITKAEIIPSRIDSIGDADELAALVRAADTNLHMYEIKRFTDMPKGYLSPFDTILENYARKNKLGKPFYRADFDNNGYTDLLLHGGWNLSVSPDPVSFNKRTIVLMNFGNDKYQVYSLHKNLNAPVLAEPASLEGFPGVVVHSPFRRLPLMNDTLKIRHDTLVYKFGNFVEYKTRNTVDESSSIVKIEYAAGPCFGTCPMYQMIIEDNRQAYFIAEAYNFDNPEKSVERDEGTFETQLKRKDYNKLMGLLSYLTAQNLQNDYEVSYTCASTCYLRITYSDGKVKRIRDYGKAGTYSLRALYNMFDDFRLSQDWKPIKEPKGIRMSWW